MKSSSELFKRYPELTQDALTNYRRSRYLSCIKSGQKHSYYERSFIELGFALSRIREGVSPRHAFKGAREQFESNASQVRAFVADFVDEHAGHGPTQSQILKALHGEFADLPSYVTALAEESGLGASGASRQITLLGTYQPTDMPAYTSQRKSAFQILPVEMRERLRKVAFEKYREQTTQLEEESRLPAPLNFIQTEGITVERRLLKLGVKGYSDLDGNVITISMAISPGSILERWILAHEYFHLFLKHQVASEERENEIIEAQATYTAVHYLIPLEVFDRILSAVSYSSSSVNEQNRILAKHFGVGEGVIKRYRQEMFPGRT